MKPRRKETDDKPPLWREGYRAAMRDALRVCEEAGTKLAKFPASMGAAMCVAEIKHLEETC